MIIKNRKSQKRLTYEDVYGEIKKRDKKIGKLTFLESYAMFMGKCQILEFGLKRLLTDECGFTYEQVEKKTLGWTIINLQKNKLRSDFLGLLSRLLVRRNDFAHNFLADFVIISSLLRGKVMHKPFLALDKALFEVEEALMVFDFIKENGSFWMNTKHSKAKINIV